MPIDRGPFNALVDDDGSNSTGSLWNKNAIKTVLLDPMDAALGYGGVWLDATPANISDDAGTTLSASIALARYVRLSGTTVVFQFRANPITTVAITNGIWLNFVPFNVAGVQQLNGVSLSDVPMYLDIYSANRFRLKKTDFTNFVVGSHYAGFTAIFEALP